MEFFKSSIMLEQYLKNPQNKNTYLVLLLAAHLNISLTDAATKNVSPGMDFFLLLKILFVFFI